jgi:S-disulfanyl-L-cysteine oxidoreductase SoxD
MSAFAGYIRRAMPFNTPRSLTDNEVYALTAYILSLNKLISDPVKTFLSATIGSRHC